MESRSLKTPVCLDSGEDLLSTWHSRWERQAMCMKRDSGEVPGSFSTSHPGRNVISPMRSVLIPSKTGVSMTHLPSAGPDYFKLPPS